MKVNHAERKHAILSASGSSRWLNCTPSARLEEKMPSSTSTASEEGTLAHEISDLIIKRKLKIIDLKTFNSEIRTLRKHALYYPEMEEELVPYIDYCVDAYKNALKYNPNAVALVEERLNFSHLVKGGFGTGDFGIGTDHTIEIIDLKFGKGVEVHAEENSQLMLYGSAVLRRFEFDFDVEFVKLTIIQPRINNFSTWTISVEDLEKWGEEVVKPKALEAYTGEGEQKVGSWCKFCKVKATCRAMSEFSLDTAKHDFKDPHELTIQELVDIHKQSDMIIEWLKSIHSYLQNKAIGGEKIEGYKVVESKTNRKFTNEEKVKEILNEKGFMEFEYIKESLEGITTIEKIVGKKEFNSLLGPYILKPKGAPIMVPESDKRAEWSESSAAEDFS